MTTQSRDANAPEDLNLVRLEREVERTTQACAKVSEAAEAASEAILRAVRKQEIEAQIQFLATEETMLKRDLSVLGDAREAQRRLADKQRELAELREQLKREFPENERRWWHALLFWQKS